jgi:hypothetical protein
MHHFNGAAGKTEGHGPEGALSSPVGYLVEGGEGVLHGAFLGFLRGEGHLSSQTAGDREAIIRGGCADGRERCCGFGG